uniref:Putative Type II secretory pathway, pseudopilin PulG n=1 Tax=mine drainage metagenome TaxID=410659 RepID=E6QW19_9ZZZZ
MVAEQHLLDNEKRGCVLIRQQGVTLIETLIAIVISGLLLAMGVSRYQSFIQNGQVRTAAESVLNGLQLARGTAASKNTQVSFTLNGNDWSVDVVANPVYGIAASNVQSRVGAETKMAVIAASQNPVIFDSSGRLTPVPAANITYTITNPTAGACAVAGANGGIRCMNVVVQAGGLIRMCDPALLLANNPQGC